MHKMPTVFVRDPDNMARVLNQWHPDCLWVRDGEGTPTRKYDGTCVMRTDDTWWARREVKPGKATPAEYRAVSTDPATGKTVGWEPIGQSPFAKAFHDADPNDVRGDGTYELCGPKINGNPEGFDRHTLIRHDDADRVSEFCDEIGPIGWGRTYDSIRDSALLLAGSGIEGIVWHAPDGRRAKIKGRDFGPSGDQPRC